MGFINVLKYSGPNARIRAMKSRLLEKKEFESAMKNPTIDEFFISLENSQYKENLHNKEIRTVGEIEKFLQEELIKTYQKVMNIAPSSTKEFFEEFFRRYELSFLKNLINYKSGGGGSIEIYGELILSSELSKISQKLRDAKGVDELILSLENTRYKFLENYLEIYKNTSSVFPLLIALDRDYFQELMKKIEKLRGKDRAIAKELFSFEIDAINIMTLLRNVKMKKEDKTQCIIPYFHHLSEKLVDECTECDSVEGVIKKLSDTPYGKILSQYIEEYKKTKSLLPFELSLKKYSLVQHENFLRAYPFQIGTLLGYLKLKEVEIRNLIAISIGIGYNLPVGELIS